MICRTFTGMFATKKARNMWFTPACCSLRWAGGSRLHPGQRNDGRFWRVIGIGYGSVTPVFQTQIISSWNRIKSVSQTPSSSMRWMQAGAGSLCDGDDGCTYWLPNDYLLGALLVVVAGGVYALQMKVKAVSR